MSHIQAGSFVSGYEQYWRKSGEDIDTAIRSSLIVLDTNTLLNLYRMKPSARREYLKVLVKISERLWIPRQVADEFHRNRLTSVSSHLNSLKEKAASVKDAAVDLEKALGDFYKLHSLADGRSRERVKPLNDLIAKVTGVVDREVGEFDLTPEGLLERDPILEQLAKILDGKVGSPFSGESLDETMKEALRRGDEQIPPGYLDVQKKKEGGVGDYFIWRQMLEKAKGGSRDILFVSTDLKKDWTRVQCGLSIGPRPELVREMKEVADVGYGQIPLADFLVRASRVLSVEVSQETIDQADSRSVKREGVAKEYAPGPRGVGYGQRVAELESLQKQIRRLETLAEHLRQRSDAAAAQVELLRGRSGVGDDAETLDERNLKEVFIDLDLARFEYRKVMQDLQELRAQEHDVVTSIRGRLQRPGRVHRMRPSGPFAG
ncbi:PIN-like domain-containing protein [Streptomyces sp. NPDC002248]